MYRRVQLVISGTETSDGAGVKLRRVFGKPEVPRFDPYLMLDFFDSMNPMDYNSGFPWHPHRGIETITFLLAGEIEHADSLGNSGTISAGDCQWMTAGSGIVHEELPKPSHHMWGIQLWANLRAADKMTHPRYRGIPAAKIPLIADGSSRVRVIAGSFSGVSGPAQRPDIDACFLDIEIQPGQTFEVEKDPEQTVFALLAGGQADFDGQSTVVRNAGSAVLYERSPSASRKVGIKAGPNGARLLLVSGKPIGEPVAWGGPIVMNTREELDLAFREYQDGTFIKDKANLGDWHP